MIIDAEFQKMLPEPDDESTAILRDDIKKNGVLEPLVVWKEADIMIDGHRRHQIAEELGVTFKVRYELFDDRESAADWIDRNQLQRRNLSPGQISLVRGRRYNRLKRPYGGAEYGRKDRTAKSAGRTTADILADDHGVSERTIHHDGKFAAAVGILKAVDPQIEQRVARGDIPSKTAVVKAAKVAKADPQKAKQILQPTGQRKRLPRRPINDRLVAAAGSLEGLAVGLESITDAEIKGLDSTEFVAAAKLLISRLRKALKRIEGGNNE